MYTEFKKTKKEDRNKFCNPTLTEYPGQYSALAQKKVLEELPFRNSRFVSTYEMYSMY